MKGEQFVTNGLGWVDDFRAPAGECGHPITRMIHAKCLLSQGSSVSELKRLGFSRQMITEVTNMIINEEYKLNVGDLVQEFLTEKIGVITEASSDNKSYKVLWQTTGLSLETCGAGTSEWCSWKSLETLSERKT